MDGGSVLVLFGFWMVLVVGNMILLATSRDAALKRLVSTVMMVLVSVAIGGVILLFSLQTWVALIFLPFLALTVFVNARRIRFCDVCGMTNFIANPFKSVAFCSDCGKPLDPKRMWF